ncbi:MAG: hypothetical protein VX913_13510, partial [Planctomycetota bacterium]|nr:hypothetical protein [Planctomycetota bacterium]
MSELILRRGGSANASAARVVLIAASLVFIGLLVQLAVTTTRSVDPHALVRRQIIYASLAGLVGLAAYGFGYRRAVAWSRPLLIGTWVLLGFLLIPGGAHIGC